MRRFKFGKLVRDKIVEDILATGGKPKWRVLSKKNYILELKKKISEEAVEILTSKGKELLEEVADVQEIIDNLLTALGKKRMDLLETQKDKNRKRGSFKKRHYIDFVEVENKAKVVKFYLGHSDKYPEIKK